MHPFPADEKFTKTKEKPPERNCGNTTNKKAPQKTPHPKSFLTLAILDHEIDRLYKLYINFTLPETNIVPENGWLEYDRFLLGPGLFSGASCYFEGGYLSS